MGASVHRVCVCVCVWGPVFIVCVCVCVCVWGPVFFVCVLGGLVFSVCVCVWGPVFISLSLHDLPVYCPLTTGPILLLLPAYASAGMAPECHQRGP